MVLINAERARERSGCAVEQLGAFPSSIEAGGESKVKKRQERKEGRGIGIVGRGVNIVRY